MKEFEFLNFDEFIEVADGLETPFKFYEISQTTDDVCLEVRVWLKSAYISFSASQRNFDQLKDFIDRLNNHGFNHVRIKETAIQIK